MQTSELPAVKEDTPFDMVLVDTSRGLCKARVGMGPLPGLVVVQPAIDEDGHRLPPVDVHRIEWARAVVEGRTTLGYTEYQEPQLWLTLEGG